jgi:hypothetical protein
MEYGEWRDSYCGDEFQVHSSMGNELTRLLPTALYAVCWDFSRHNDMENIRRR